MPMRKPHCRQMINHKHRQMTSPKHRQRRPCDGYMIRCMNIKEPSQILTTSLKVLWMCLLVAEQSTSYSFWYWFLSLVLVLW